MKSGDSMSYESMRTEFDSSNRLKFKLYSLEYLIEKVDNYVQIYAIDYPTRKSKYNTLEELVNNFTIYNEPLVTILNSAKIID